MFLPQPCHGNHKARSGRMDPLKHVYPPPPQTLGQTLSPVMDRQSNPPKIILGEMAVVWKNSELFHRKSLKPELSFQLINFWTLKKKPSLQDLQLCFLQRVSLEPLGVQLRDVHQSGRHKAGPPTSSKLLFEEKKEEKKPIRHGWKSKKLP